MDLPQRQETIRMLGDAFPPRPAALICIQGQPDVGWGRPLIARAPASPPARSDPRIAPTALAPLYREGHGLRSIHRIRPGVFGISLQGGAEISGRLLDRA